MRSPTHSEFEAFPPTLKRKCFSTLERLRYAQAQAQAQAHTQVHTGPSASGGAAPRSLLSSSRRSSKHLSNVPRRRPVTLATSTASVSRPKSITSQVPRAKRATAPLSANMTFDLSNEDALWFARLPDKVKRGQFTQEEQEMFAGRQESIVMPDATDELFRKLRHGRPPPRSTPSLGLDDSPSASSESLGSPNPLDHDASIDDNEEADWLAAQTVSSPNVRCKSNSMERHLPHVDIAHGHDAEDATHTTLDAFAWVTGHPDELDDYHRHVAETAHRNLKDATKQPSYRRQPFGGLPLGGLNIMEETVMRGRSTRSRTPQRDGRTGRKISRPAPITIADSSLHAAQEIPERPKTPQPVNFSWPSPASSPPPAPRSVHEQPLSSPEQTASPCSASPSIKVFETATATLAQSPTRVQPATPTPTAAHYLNPEARLKLRLYLANPSKFDEAVEFGFPAASDLAGSSRASQPASKTTRRPSAATSTRQYAVKSNDGSHHGTYRHQSTRSTDVDAGRRPSIVSQLTARSLSAGPFPRGHRRSKSITSNVFNHSQRTLFGGQTFYDDAMTTKTSSSLADDRRATMLSAQSEPGVMGEYLLDLDTSDSETRTEAGGDLTKSPVLSDEGGGLGIEHKTNQHVSQATHGVIQKDFSPDPAAQEGAVDTVAVKSAHDDDDADAVSALSRSYKPNSSAASVSSLDSTPHTRPERQIEKQWAILGTAGDLLRPFPLTVRACTPSPTSSMSKSPKKLHCQTMISPSRLNLAHDLDVPANPWGSPVLDVDDHAVRPRLLTSDEAGSRSQDPLALPGREMTLRMTLTRPDLRDDENHPAQLQPLPPKAPAVLRKPAPRAGSTKRSHSIREKVGRSLSIGAFSAPATTLPASDVPPVPTYGRTLRQEPEVPRTSELTSTSIPVASKSKPMAASSNMPKSMATEEFSRPKSAAISVPPSMTVTTPAAPASMPIAVAISTPPATPLRSCLPPPSIQIPARTTSLVGPGTAAASLARSLAPSSVYPGNVDTAAEPNESHGCYYCTDTDVASAAPNPKIDVASAALDPSPDVCLAAPGPDTEAGSVAPSLPVSHDAASWHQGPARMADALRDLAELELGDEAATIAADKERARALWRQKLNEGVVDSSAVGVAVALGRGEAPGEGYTALPGYEGIDDMAGHGHAHARGNGHGNGHGGWRFWRGKS